MTLRDDQPPLDAEKIASEHLKHVFRQPPGLGAFPPSRSTLLVGARGSGKTMLLRTARHNEKYVAIYGDLRKILNGVSADTGAGGLSFHQISPSEEGYLQDKTASLLALWLAQESRHRQLALSPSGLGKAMPSAVRSQIPNDGEMIDWLEENLPTLKPGVFRPTPNLEFLYSLIDDLAAQARAKYGKELVLLLDRAEEVPFPCLIPVLHLLDQNHPCRVVVACRPGILGATPNVHPSLPRAGDHYDVRHLGYAPYSSEWKDFQRKVLSAWIPNSAKALPSSALETLLLLSRDSIRCALELVYNSVDEHSEYNQNRSSSVVTNLQTALLDAAQGSLRKLNDDIGSIPRAIRRADGYKLPVLLTILKGRINAKSQLHLLDNVDSFDSSTRAEQFVRLGLRTWFFSVPHGTHWTPSVHLESVEINPIFLWEPGDKWGL